jgi:hypothetical protein
VVSYSRLISLEQPGQDRVGGHDPHWENQSVLDFGETHHCPSVLVVWSDVRGFDAPPRFTV